MGRIKVDSEGEKGIKLHCLFFVFCRCVVCFFFCLRAHTHAGRAADKREKQAPC